MLCKQHFNNTVNGTGIFQQDFSLEKQQLCCLHYATNGLNDNFRTLQKHNYWHVIIYLVNTLIMFSLISHATQVLISAWESTLQVLIIRHQHSVQILRSSLLVLPCLFITEQSISCHYTANDALSSACTVWLIVLLRSRLMTWWENYWSNDLGQCTTGRWINK